MKPVTTVGDAAFGPFATYDRDVWRDDPAWPVSQVYVERDGQTPGSLTASRPYLRIKRHLLRSSNPQRFLLHGQIGAGKSMELRRLVDDDDVSAKLEIVNLSLSEQLNLAAEVSIRLVLLALAYRLAEHLVNQHDVAVSSWGVAPTGTDERVLREWLRVLTPGKSVPDTGKVSAQPWVVSLKGGLFNKTVTVRSDDGVRKQLLTEDDFAPSHLRDLVHALLVRLRQAADRPVLLVVDDGDKIGDDTATRDVFVRNIELLLFLPASCILTVPFWLHFDPDFRAATGGIQRVALANVKVINHDAPRTLVPEGSAFFWNLYDRLATRDIIEDAAFQHAARLSGGIPREFIRLLRAGFDLADERGLDVLNVATLGMALAGVRREMLGFTQDKQVRDALSRIHRTRHLDGNADWKLLNALLVVEYTNGQPWYDVHPLLVDDVERWS